MAVLNLPAPFDDDVGVFLEQAENLLPGRDLLTLDDSPFGLVDDLQHQ